MIKMNQRIVKERLVKVMSMALAFSMVGAVGTTQLPEIYAAQTTNVLTNQQNTNLSRFSMEGFADSRNVTGAGSIEESSENYYKVSNAEQFIKALYTISKSGKASAIEITNDIALGSKEVGSSLLSTYSRVINASKNQPLLHPTLLKTGVSQVDLKNIKNLTIFSKDGAKISHACFNISASRNIIIRNITFDEIWEWDEATSGDYDRNDWDYITVQGQSTGIWIDHCTFYKAYDGIIDVKKAAADATTDVTISWCEFLPGSEGSFFDDMMTVLEKNPTDYPYYNKLITTYKMTKNQVRQYANAQKKTHLIGASDSESNIGNLNLTLANNHYKNTMDRLPRLRGGNAHVYNCIMDSNDLYNLRKSLSSSSAKSKIVSNAAISTCGASVLLENTCINGIENVLLSGNGNSPAGYIGSEDCLYYLDGVAKSIKVTDKTSSGLVLDQKAFRNALPYKAYTLYDASELTNKVLPYVGAGVMDLSNEAWLSTEYTDITEDTDDDTTEDVVEDDKDDTTEDVVEDDKDDTTGDVVEDNKDNNIDGVITSYRHNFTTSGKESSYFNITGSLSSSKGTVMYEGITLNTSLKMESSTKVVFDVTSKAIVTLVANTDCNKTIMVDGVAYPMNQGILQLEVSKGTHTITKADSNVNLYLVDVVIK